METTPVKSFASLHKLWWSLQEEYKKEEVDDSMVRHITLVEPQPELFSDEEQFTGDKPSDEEEFHQPGPSKQAKCNQLELQLLLSFVFFS